MEIDVTCPQCKGAAISKLRKVTVPGIVSVCKSCEAEVAINRIFSFSNVAALTIWLLLIKLFPDTVLYWLGWAVLLVGCAYHLVRVPLKVVNPGPNHAKYHS